MIEWMYRVLSRFQCYFSYIAVATESVHAFLVLPFTNSPRIILSKPLADFPHTNVETMVSDERGINPVAMTVINPGKEIVQAGIESAIPCSSVKYATNLAKYANEVRSHFRLKGGCA